MSDVTVHILIGLTVAVTIGGVVIIVISSQAARGQAGRSYDLVLILGIAWLVGGLAAQNFVVGGLGLAFSLYGAAKSYNFFKKR